MRLYVFAEKGALAKTGGGEERIREILERIAEGTDTTNLVVAVYLRSRLGDWEAHSLTELIGPGDFLSVRGEWDFVEDFATPPGLPDRFLLVRIILGMRRRYPAAETDIYGWELTFEGFEDHLAHTFAHELHHFRRHHLGLHPGEGEQSACKWALQRAQAAGFQVSGLRVPEPRRRKRRKRKLRLPVELRPWLLRRIKLSAAHLCEADLRELRTWIRRRLDAVAAQRKDTRLQEHFEKLRKLPQGAPVYIRSDDASPGYTGQTAVKIRNLRRDSPRMLIRTADGEEWNYPMESLEVTEMSETSPQQQTLFVEDGHERA